MKAIEDIDPDLDADDIVDDEAEDDESDDDDDDEAELMRELQKIKAERAAEAAERVSILLIPFSPNHSPRLLSVHSGEEKNASGSPPLSNSTGVRRARCSHVRLSVICRRLQRQKKSSKSKQTSS
jgi:hypothetical protein